MLEFFQNVLYLNKIPKAYVIFLVKSKVMIIFERNSRTVSYLGDLDVYNNGFTKLLPEIANGARGMHSEISRI